MKWQSESHSTYDVREVSTDLDRIRRDEFQGTILKSRNVYSALSYTKLLSNRNETEVRAVVIYYRNMQYCSVCGIGAGLPPNSTTTTTVGKGTYSFTQGSNAATNQIVI